MPIVMIGLGGLLLVVSHLFALLSFMGEFERKK
jgi:hypothetical protein